MKLVEILTILESTNTARIHTIPTLLYDMSRLPLKVRVEYRNIHGFDLAIEVNLIYRQL